MVPDEETQTRLKSLGQVGEALYSASNDSSYSTNFYLAKAALHDFQSHLNLLSMEEDSKRGMTYLIRYLEREIDKRINAN
jgi:hypothetical protein